MQHVHGRTGSSNVACSMLLGSHAAALLPATARLGFEEACATCSLSRSCSCCHKSGWAAVDAASWTSWLPSPMPSGCMCACMVTCRVVPRCTDFPAAAVLAQGVTTATEVLL